MSKRFRWRGEIKYEDNIIRKVLEVDVDKERVKFKNGKIILEENSISKFRGLINSYLRLIKLILEVKDIGKGREDS